MNRRLIGNVVQCIKNQHDDQSRKQGKLQMLPDTFIDRSTPGNEAVFSKNIIKKMPDTSENDNTDRRKDTPDKKVIFAGMIHKNDSPCKIFIKRRSSFVFKNRIIFLP